MQTLRHINIVQLLGSGISSTGRFVIVQEFVSDHTLHDVLDTLPWPSRIRVALGIVQAVNYLHSQVTPGLHRDFKSDNVLVEVCDLGFANGRAKLGDCGRARSFQEHSALSTRGNSSTRICGALGYIDP